MATTNVLLREDVEKLGARGEIVKVKAGYARNYLLPRKLAVEATSSNLKQIEQERAALLKREAKERSTAEAQAKQLGSLRLVFQRKVGEHGILYGSVTSMDIAEALKDKGYEMDRRRIHLADTIKEPGDYSVNVKLHREVSVDIPINVVREENQ
jgi:large subunit ribosomal protein L9